MQNPLKALLSPQTSQVPSFAQQTAEKREAVIAALDALKADNIVVIDLAHKATFADYLIIATGTSSRHLAALATAVGHTLVRQGQRAQGVEGQNGSEWVCLDAGDLVIHLFTPNSREHYRLEKLWSFPSIA